MCIYIYIYLFLRGIPHACYPAGRSYAHRKQYPWLLLVFRGWSGLPSLSSSCCQKYLIGGARVGKCWFSSIRADHLRQIIRGSHCMYSLRTSTKLLVANILLTSMVACHQRVVSNFWSCFVDRFCEGWGNKFSKKERQAIEAAKPGSMPPELTERLSTAIVACEQALKDPCLKPSPLAPMFYIYTCVANIDCP